MLSSPLDQLADPRRRVSRSARGDSAKGFAAVLAFGFQLPTLDPGCLPCYAISAMEYVGPNRSGIDA